MNFTNKTALVTGANRGIGLALVTALLKAGARKVYAGARNPDQLAAAVALDPNRVTPLRLDIADRSQVDAAAAAAGDVEILINNAGVLDFGDALTVPVAAIERNFAVNVFGTLAMARAFAPIIEKNGGGAITNLLSVVSLASIPGLAGYNASKAALWSLTQSLRGTLAARGISVHGVFPGPVDTDMASEITMPKTSPAEVAQAILEGMASGAEDIFPDPMAREVYAGWSKDHKAVERQFAAL
ncbi:MAG: SDR family oxidoreductase [Elsteraceae bacterium]